MRAIPVFQTQGMPPPPVAEKNAAPLPPVEAPIEPEHPAGETGSAAIVALELVQLKAQYERQLAGMAAASKEAAAEIAALRRDRAGSLEQVALERRVAAEFSKKLSACQKELEAALGAAKTLQTERDRAHAQVAALQLCREKAPDSAGGGEQAKWETRVASQFEEDIEAYRKRIQLLLGERDALRAENGQLNARLAELSAVAKLIG
jgi:chromosome segregation ATPase